MVHKARSTVTIISKMPKDQCISNQPHLSRCSDSKQDKTLLPQPLQTTEAPCSQIHLQETARRHPRGRGTSLTRRKGFELTRYLPEGDCLTKEDTDFEFCHPTSSTATKSADKGTQRQNEVNSRKIKIFTCLDPRMYISCHYTRFYIQCRWNWGTSLSPGKGGAQTGNRGK